MIVIPGGITHNFVALAIAKTRTVFVPFGLLIVLATLRVARRFLTLTGKQVNCSPFEFVTVGPEGLEPPTSTV